MEILTNITHKSPKSCQIGDSFKIEGATKTVTAISKKYIYFDKGNPVPFKIFNHLVRQCKLLKLNNNLDAIKKELEEKIDRLNTYIEAQERTIKQFDKLCDNLLDDVDKLKKNTKDPIISNPISLRYIVLYHYGDKPYYEWLFAKKHCFHSDMEAEYEEENGFKDYNVVGGGFYVSFTEIDYDEDREYNINTIMLFGESGTYGNLSQEHLTKALPYIDKKYDVKVLKEKEEDWGNPV